MNEAPEKFKVRLTGAEATLLVTLYAKALDNHSPYSLLHDAKAEEIVDAIEIDPAVFKGLRADDLIVVRARHYDEWVRDFLAKNGDAVVVYLGAGLDTRITRIDPPSTVSWFDVDFPSVIQLRRNFYADQAGYAMIASSVTDPGWLRLIPVNRPTMIIAEGCLPYLTREEVKQLLNRLTDHFSHGQLALDVVNSVAVAYARRQLAETMGTAHRWTVDEIEEVDCLDANLKRVAMTPVCTSPFAKELPLGTRAFFGFISLFPPYRDTMRLALYEF
jgi:O-methyltransferase involved in polyketide biosynthesis